MKIFLLISLHLILRMGKSSRYTIEEQNALVDLHNRLRANVTPPAADMNYLEWSNEAATAAQNWANACQRSHSSKGMGQNNYYGFEKNGLEATKLWYDEYKYFNYAENECQSGQKCGHYTQVVWSETKYVGCGYKECDGYIHVICNYMPGGNIIYNDKKLKPYKVGEGCSKCLTKTGLCSNKLCVTKDICEKTPAIECNCNLRCYNCGKLQSDTCSCKCSDGWGSLNCLDVCVEKNPRCPFSVFKSPCKSYELDMCPVKCKSCKKADPKKPQNLCCGGKVCPGGFLIEETCECGKLNSKSSIAGLFYSLFTVSLMLQVLFYY